VIAQAARQCVLPGEWVLGGSAHDEGERAFGFGPRIAAMIAVEAYTVAAEMSEGVSPEEFVKRCAGAFWEGLRDVVGLPELDALPH
jgi:hypothetical protein